MSMAIVRVIATRLDGIEEERIVWYWRGRLARGKVTVMDGDPGMGKSTVGLDLIARFTRGDEMPGGGAKVPETLVGLLSDEDGLRDTIVPRLKLAGAKMANIYHLTGETATGAKRSLTIPNNADEIDAIIRREGIGYFHVDPMAGHASSDVNIYVDQEVRTKFMGPLGNLAEETGVTTTVVRHPTKQIGGPALYRGGGSIGIIGAARFGLYFGRDPEDPTRHVIANSKTNIGPIPPSLVYQLIGVEGTDHARVQWDDEPSHLTADDLSAAPRTPKVEPKNDAQQWLLQYLAPGPRQANAVLAAADAAGHKERTVRRAKADLGITSEREGFGENGAFVWALPGDAVPEGGLDPSPLHFDWGSPNGIDSPGDRWTH